MGRHRGPAPRAVAVWLAVLVAGAILLVPSLSREASGATSGGVEGEALTFPDARGKVFRDARASAGRGLGIERPAPAARTVRTPALSGISVRARGEQCGGAPRMLVYLDGRQVMSRLVRSNFWRLHEARVSAGAGDHTVRVEFRGDRRASRCDRDLKVDVVRFAAAPEPPPSTPEPAKQTCERSLQKLVDGAAPGSVVEVPGGCVYRETVEVNRPVTLKAGPGAEIRGSDVWTGWTRSGPYWVKGTLPAFQGGGYCKPGTERCQWPEQVYLDGEPLRQVASDPQGGEFAVDANRRVVLADDPEGRTVEVTTRPYWVVGRSGGVSIEGFTMKHAANEVMSGAIKNDGHDDWVVRNNDLSYAHGANLKLGAATGLLAAGNDIHHGGWMGISGSYADLEVRGNSIHHNNTEGFDPGWAAGGMKNARMIRLVADGNEVYENDRVGLWCDEGCRNVTYSNNRVHHNAQIGLHFEIGDGARISGNEVWENGWGVADTSFGEAGILVASSRDVEVDGNVLAWNNDGITVVNHDRHQGDGTQYDTVTNVAVHHNDVFGQDRAGGTHMGLAWVKAYADGNIYDAAANNRGHDNRYFFPNPEGAAYRYKWGPALKRLADFNDTPGAERARYLTATEKNAVAESRGVPAAPER